jgi:hypothetical protein
MTLRLSAALKAAVMLALPLALALAVYPDQARAQNLRKDAAGNSYGPRLDNIGALTTKKRVRSPHCRDMTLDLNISTPYGTGIEEFDEAMARKHERDVERYQNEIFQAIREDCQYKPDLTESSYTRTFEAHYPGGGSFSVLYSIDFYAAGYAHPSYNFEADNVNPWTGRDLAMEDLFESPPGARAGLRALWPIMARAWCRYNDERRLPNFYDMPENQDWCKNPAKAPMPQRLQGRPEIKDLGNAFLTAGGLELRLAPYDGWNFALGPASLSIDKSTLIGIGFKPGLWGR